MRPSGRALDEMRIVKFTRNYTKHTEGSVLVEMIEIQNKALHS